MRELRNTIERAVIVCDAGVIETKHLPPGFGQASLRTAANDPDDLRPKRLTGKIAEEALGRAHITCNKNEIPFDPEKPTVTSGIRLGSPAGTTRGFGVKEFQEVGNFIAEVLNVLSKKGVAEDALVESAVREKVKTLLSRFPIYR